MSRSLLVRTSKAAGYFITGFTTLGAIGTGITYYDFQRQYERPHSWSTKPMECSLDDILEINHKSTALSQDEIASYHRDGYVVARNIIPVSYISALRNEALLYAEKYRGSLYPFDKYSGRNAIHRPSLHAHWACHMAHNLGNIGVGEASSSLLNSNEEPSSIHLVFDTLDYILPAQKSAYLAPVRKETEGHRNGVRAWVPLENIDKNNSPPIVVPGSHRWAKECFMGHGPCALCFGSSLRETPKCPCNDELIKNKNKWNTKILDDMVEGDVVFINPKCLHSTGGPNNTDTPRLGLRLHLKTEQALNDYKKSATYKKIQTKKGWVIQLLRGWSPSHPRFLDEVTAPKIWPLIDENEYHTILSSWPREEPTFSDCMWFAAGSLGRWLIWYAVGSREVLQPQKINDNMD